MDGRIFCRTTSFPFVPVLSTFVSYDRLGLVPPTFACCVPPQPGRGGGHVREGDLLAASDQAPREEHSAFFGAVTSAAALPSGKKKGVRLYFYIQWVQKSRSNPEIVYVCKIILMSSKAGFWCAAMMCSFYRVIL